MDRQKEERKEGCVRVSETNAEMLTRSHTVPLSASAPLPLSPTHTGGDLFSQIVEHGKYSEKQAIRACKQLAEALLHIHKCGITVSHIRLWRGRVMTSNCSLHFSERSTDADICRFCSYACVSLLCMSRCLTPPLSFIFISTAI